MGAGLVYDPEPFEVRFLRRPNRFLAEVQPLSGDRPQLVHVPNPGRMEELLIPGQTRGYVRPVAREGRRTRGTLVTVEHDGTLVSIDTLAANTLVGAALRSGAVTGFGRVGWRAEVSWGPHRFDFARLGRRRPDVAELLEVKSSNLKVGDLALFPDAPTERGARHLEALADERRRGLRCSVVIVVQRGDARAFAPNRALDPEFARAFDRAVGAGVRVVAYSLRVAPDRLEWGRRLPVVVEAKENLFRRVGPNAGR